MACSPSGGRWQQKLSIVIGQGYGEMDTEYICQKKKTHYHTNFDMFTVILVSLLSV